MKISITDTGSGIALKFAKAIGATVKGRFIYIPESKGTGYITGFSWGKELRVLIRNYYLKEDVFIERTNELPQGRDVVVFRLSGVFPSPIKKENTLYDERPRVLVFREAVSSVMAMFSNTIFGSIDIAVSRQYLRSCLGHIDHPIAETVLEGNADFLYETEISPQMVKTASEMLDQSVPESLESYFHKLKCEELLCYTLGILLRREAVPTRGMHIKDIKAIYATKTRLHLRLDKPPDIALQAMEAGMSQPKMRKLFKQTFGKGVFEYYQSMRMEEAARLLKEQGLTVSEVGHRLGFTNLSHFSRVFEQHFHMKPKKYSANAV